MTVTISYANAQIRVHDPNSYSLFVSSDGGKNWEEDFNNFVNDPVSKTITVTVAPGDISSFPDISSLIFTLGCCSSGSGGGGGGVGFGTGLVLDLLGPVIVESTNPPSNPNDRLEETLTSPSDSIKSTLSNSANPTTTSIVTGTGASTNPAADEQLSQSQNKAIREAVHSANITIPISGEGNITLSFTSLPSGTNPTVTAVKTLSEIPGLSMTNTQRENVTLITLNKTHYNLGGTFFNIGPIDARFNGSVSVSIPYDTHMVSQSGPEVRLMHYKGSSWEDVTSLPPADDHSVTGSLDSLGLVVVGS